MWNFRDKHQYHNIGGREEVQEDEVDNINV